MSENLALVGTKNLKSSNSIFVFAVEQLFIGICNKSPATMSCGVNLIHVLFEYTKKLRQLLTCPKAIFM